MKKFLSLLGVLTITGTTIPNLISASPYQKQEKLNNDINYLRTNNLKILSRVKRTNNIGGIPTWNNELNINEEFSEVDFYNTITEIRNWLRSQNVLLLTSTNSDGSTTNPYAINPDLNNNNNFIIPVSFENRRINLVFRSSDLYLQGYTINVGNNNFYYHFEDSTTININGYNSLILRFPGSYTRLLPLELYITWDNILDSFRDLIRYSEPSQNAININRSLGFIIIFIAESLRFNSIQSLIDNNFRWQIDREQRPLYWNPSLNEIENWLGETNVNYIVTRWDTNSQSFFRNYINQNFGTQRQNQISILSIVARTVLANFCYRNYLDEKRPRRNPNNILLCSKYKKQELSTVITTTDLGALNDKNKDTILAAVKAKNPNLDINDIGISQITDTSADINGLTEHKDSYNSNKYKNWKRVYFKVKPDLKTDFKKCIDPVDNIDDDTILAAVKAKNPNLDISQVYIKEKIPNGRLNIAVKNDSNKYNTNSEIWGCNNFKVKPDLNEIITITDLGALNDWEDSTIINSVKAKNNLKNLNYTIRNKTHTSAEFWIDNKNDYYKQWSWRKIYFQINCTNTILTGVGAGGAGGATAGALTGASIGSVIPGFGTAVGAAVGGVIGFFAGAGAGGTIVSKKC